MSNATNNILATFVSLIILGLGVAALNYQDRVKILEADVAILEEALARCEYELREAYAPDYVPPQED